jgi:hypothetical protein
MHQTTGAITRFAALGSATQTQQRHAWLHRSRAEGGRVAAALRVTVRVR